ncbi:Na+/H+ antiporter NhaC family protein [Olegusella massiliensis]|uniref:Na+/H+ antiporter NhaC family protein n=1 Tax=Olegusella massiliensis TaxID=1776381 RepID=UPI0023F97A09|nr:Na+/H+ antiporter NhaC family protein [Olegusella massiliensis]
MAEYITLGLFVVILLVTLSSGIPLVVSLAMGLMIFLAYGLFRGHKPQALFGMIKQGVSKVRPVLLLLLIIGAITASWRASGTIPAIVCLSTQIISPQLCLLAIFLLCSAMSTLMGTSFGAAATMGVICMTIARAMGINPMFAGGAILAGAYCGDRWSPMSSSAFIVATITDTDIFDNVKRMLRTGIVPFIGSCILYVLIGIFSAGSGTVPNVSAAFSSSFEMSPVVLLPAFAVIVLSAFKVRVHITMLVSLALASLICVFVQGVPVGELPALYFGGFHSMNPALAHMVDGGGIHTMLEIIAIISIAGSYATIFEGTGLICGMRGMIQKISQRYTPFVSVLITSVLAAIISCEQTLAVMLTQQLCDDVEGDGSALALDLENSAIVITALVPWSITCAAILSFVDAPTSCIVWAFLLYLIPLWTLLLSFKSRKDPNFVASEAGRLLGLAEHDDVRRVRGTIDALPKVA